MTRLYYSCSSHSSEKAIEEWPWEEKPISILVAFTYLGEWRRDRRHYRAPAGLMLDSGAFSAHQAGAVVDIDALVEEAKNPEWSEVIALDVIGDADASVRNADYMWSRGCDRALPTFHLGDPWDHLAYYASRSRKVALGGMVGASSKLVMKFVRECFARVWPKRLHSFGRCEEDLLLAFPFHSADTASWIMGPAFGRAAVKRRGRETTTSLRTRGAANRTHLIRGHMEALHRREASLRQRWARELAALEAACQ